MNAAPVCRIWSLLAASGLTAGLPGSGYVAGGPGPLSAQTPCFRNPPPAQGAPTLSETPSIPTATPAARHVAGTAKGSRASVRASLNRAARALAGHDADGERVPWHTRPPDTLAAMRAALADRADLPTDHPDRLAVASVNASLAAVRGAVRAAWLAGDMERDALERATAALRRVPGSSAPGRALSPAQVGRLFRAAAAGRNPASAARDAALLAMLFGLGLRRAEAAAATMEDLDAEAGTLRVRGKGRRERLAHLAGGTVRALADWTAVRGAKPGPILAPVTKGGEPLSGRGMSGQAVAARVRTLAARAGLREHRPPRPAPLVRDPATRGGKRPRRRRRLHGPRLDGHHAHIRPPGRGRQGRRRRDARRPLRRSPVGRGGEH